MTTAAPRMTPEELLARLVAFDTTSRNSNLELIGFVREYLSAHGVASRLVPSDDGSKASLFASLGPDGPGGVALSGHTDVVPVDGQDWTTAPFETVRRDGRIYGRGTADMKGFIAVVLAMVPDFLAARLPVPVHLVLSYDEEVGCTGIRPLIAQIGRELPRPDLVIIGEPTEMRVANAHKGILAYRTEVTGLEAHSSATHLGVNAIDAAARAIAFLGDLGAELAARPTAGPRDHEFQPPYTTVNVGTIEGGTALNIIPRSCGFDWECRPLPGSDGSEIAARLGAYVTDVLLPPMRARHPGADIQTGALVTVPALVPQEGSPAESLARTLTGANRATVISFGTEAGLFQEAGVPAVICGPGSIDQAHRPDEWIEQSQLAACTGFMERLIDHLGRG